MTAAPIPDELADEAAHYREQLVSTLFDFSDEIAELAMQEAPIPADLMRRAIRQATIERKVVPVLAGSALDCIGIQPVLDAVAWYLPSPADVPPVEGLDPAAKTPTTITRKADPKAPFCGLVFKIIAEKHGDLAFVRVYSGTLKAGSRAWNPLRQKKENIAQLWHVQADRREQIEEAFAGDIVGVIGPRASVTGDTLCDSAAPIMLEAIQFPETVISMAIEPETSLERKKLADTLEMMKRQDPTFRALESEETGQTLISGMGELHLEVIRHRLERDFNLKCRVHKPRVSYKETLGKAVTCERRIQPAGGGADARRHGHARGRADRRAGAGDGGAGVVSRERGPRGDRGHDDADASARVPSEAASRAAPCGASGSWCSKARSRSRLPPTSRSGSRPPMRSTNMLERRGHRAPGARDEGGGERAGGAPR